MTLARNLGLLASDVNATGKIPTSAITGLATSATTDTTDASNISSGTLPSARLSGTYGINISGNAATANSAASVTSVATGNTQSNGDNTTKLATTAYVQNMGLGWGQTWKNLTSSRAASTTYQNTTNKPMCFTVYPTGYTQGELQVSTNGSTWIGVMRAADFASATGSGFAIVPPNHYYRYVGSFIYWAELS